MALSTRHFWCTTRVPSLAPRRASGSSGRRPVAGALFRVIAVVSGSSALLLSILPADAGLAAVAPTIYFYSNIAGFINGQSPPSANPSFIPLTEDGAGILEDLHWTGWGSSAARATGVSSASTCNPSCGTGKRINTPVRITLSNPGRFLGYEVYRCFQLTNLSFPRSDEYACIGRLGNEYGYVYAKKVPTPTSNPRTPSAETIAASLACAAGGIPVGSTDSAGFHCAVTSFRRSHVDPDYAVVGIMPENAQGHAESNGSSALVDFATETVVVGPSGNLGVCQFGYVPPPQNPPCRSGEPWPPYLLRLATRDEPDSRLDLERHSSQHPAERDRRYVPNRRHRECRRGNIRRCSPFERVDGRRLFHRVDLWFGYRLHH